MLLRWAQPRALAKRRDKVVLEDHLRDSQPFALGAEGLARAVAVDGCADQLNSVSHVDWSANQRSTHREEGLYEWMVIGDGR